MQRKGVAEQGIRLVRQSTQFVKKQIVKKYPERQLKSFENNRKMCNIKVAVSHIEVIK